MPKNPHDKNDSQLSDIMDVICETMNKTQKKPDGVRVNGKTIQKLRDELKKTDYVGQAYGFEIKDAKPLGNIVVGADGSVTNVESDDSLVGYFWDTEVFLDESLDDGAVEVDYPKDGDPEIKSED